MKIAFLADNQVDERSRLEEHDRVLDFIAKDAWERKCNVLLHGGDIYERRSTARERASVHRFLASVLASMPAVVVAGNHEAQGEVEELMQAFPRDGRGGRSWPFAATETPRVIIGCGTLDTIGHPEDEQIAVACLPWPRRAALASWVGQPLGRDELNAVGLDALRSVLRGFAQEWKDWKGPKILLGHCMVKGSKQGPDQPIMPGQDFELGLEDLALAEAHVNLLGHVHMPQQWPKEFFTWDSPLGPVPMLGTDIPTLYAGSPRRTAYASGELEPKGYVVLEFDGPRLVGWERVPTPATPMILIEAEWGQWPETGQEWGFVVDVPPDSDNFKGSEVRFRYTVDADHREAAKVAAADRVERMKANGAAEVKVEEIVRPRSTARLAAVAGDIPLALKLQMLWDRDGLPAEDRPRLLRRLAELEAGQ